MFMKKKTFYLKKNVLLLFMFSSILFSVRAEKSQAGNSSSFTYVVKSPLDGTTDIASYIRDVNSSNYFYLKNEKVQINFSTVSSGNNAYGSIRPGTPMDVMPVSASGYVDCLDWTEMVLVPSSVLTSSTEATTLKTWDWNSAKRNLSLPSVSVIDNEFIVASGQWDSNDSIKSTAIYTLLEGEPIMRIELTLNNSGRNNFTGAMGYIIDHDLGNQFCYLPGIANWGKSSSLPAIKSGWNSNYVYEGTDIVAAKTVPAHGLAWNTSKIQPYAVLYPGYIMGLWFSVDIPANGSQKIVFYHTVSEPSSSTPTYGSIETLATKVNSDNFVSEYIPLISGKVLNKDGITPVVGAELVCRDIAANITARSVTDANGYYTMRLPIGTYTTTSSCISHFKASRSIEVEQRIDYTLDFEMDSILTTYASYGEKMRGSLVEGGDGDLTMQNSKIALTLADEFVDGQMIASKGKPINFGLSNQRDAFDWMNMPIVTYHKELSENAWNQHCVKYTSLTIAETSDVMSRVIAEGTCDTIPLSVKTTYEIRPNETWVSAVSVFENKTASPVSVYIADAIDLDESGEKGFYYSTSTGLTTISDNNVTVEFLPNLPWIGQYGTASNQSFGVVYSGDFAQDLSLYGCQRWMMARKFVTIPAGGSYQMSRKIVAVETQSGEDRAEAFLNFYNNTFRANISLKADFQSELLKPAAGDNFKVKYVLKNESATDTCSNLRAKIVLPANLTTSSSTEMTIPEILPGQSIDIEWNVSALEGGGNRIVQASLFVNNELFNTSRIQLFVSGKGWYAADNHTHSKHSDGSGTIAENLTAARSKGLSFLSSTDHNKVSQKNDIIAFNQVNPDIIGILGNEVSTNGSGHVVALFVNQVIPYTDINTLPKAQELIDSIQRCNNNKGMAFIAHPYYPGLEWKYPLVRGMRGLEVWNGFYKPKHSVNSRSFKLWDQKIISDGEAYLGIANSDGHNSGKISDPQIRVLCDEFSEESYRNSIKRGHFYGTDGPDIRFTIGEKMMGDTLLVTQSEMPVNLNVRAMNISGIDSVRIIKNGQLIVAEKMNGETEIANVYTSVANPGDFFRVEVDGRNATFAFSNPIFVRKDVPTKIKKVFSNQYQISLNPVSKLLFIKADQSQSMNIQLISVAGIVVLQKTTAPVNEYSLSLSDLSKGVYLLRINSSVTKFVVN